ncbi:MAG: hypothetical protein IID07_09125 [Gemmatimonadetes bacterium]|nr:hypothetical protein [Gemmatimonadota bacterium]
MVARRFSRLQTAVGAGFVFGVLALAAGPHEAAAQGLTFASGQSLSPAFEGWEVNPDGSFNLLFGYMNRNWEEEPNVQIGDDNHFSPGPADRGQPTHFLPRRNRFVFKVQVPADFGEQELVWTVRVNGVEKAAYGSLKPDYFVDNMVIMSETGTLGPGSSNPELRAHTPPVVELEMESVIDARVGQPVTLTAHVTDDGLPRRSRSRLPVTDEGTLNLGRALNAPMRITVQKVMGLHLTWYVYRAPGDGEVNFNPVQIAPWEDTRPFSNSPWAPSWVPPELPEDGRWITQVTFHEPGTYILQGRADDGGLFTDSRVTVRVSRPVL